MVIIRCTTLWCTICVHGREYDHSYIDRFTKHACASVTRTSHHHIRTCIPSATPCAKCQEPSAKCYPASKQDIQLQTERLVTNWNVTYCYCRYPDNGYKMVCCDGKDGGEWLYVECINTALKKQEKWYCKNCHPSYVTLSVCVCVMIIVCMYMYMYLLGSMFVS